MNDDWQITKHASDGAPTRFERRSIFAIDGDHVDWVIQRGGGRKWIVDPAEEIPAARKCCDTVFEAMNHCCAFEVAHQMASELKLH